MQNDRFGDMVTAIWEYAGADRKRFTMLQIYTDIVSISVSSRRGRK